LPLSRTPELTNIGSFEKCWRLENGYWWMYKRGTNLELFSELLIFRIGKVLRFNMAEYVSDGDTIKTLDFTDGAHVDYEAIIGIIGEFEYIKVYQKLLSLGARIAIDFLKLCYLDALVLNMDRHEHNYGVLRNSDTGEVMDLAPLFDHNIALVARGFPRTFNFERDPLINEFASLFKHANIHFKVQLLTKEVLANLVSEIGWELPKTDECRDPENFVIEYILKRQNRLLELLPQIYD
jgi:hypothetical protein